MSGKMNIGSTMNQTSTSSVWRKSVTLDRQRQFSTMIEHVKPLNSFLGCNVSH
jgi:hypothetical protein